MSAAHQHLTAEFCMSSESQADNAHTHALDTDGRRAHLHWRLGRLQR